MGERETERQRKKKLRETGVGREEQKKKQRKEEGAQREVRGGRKTNLDSTSSLSFLLCKTEVSIKRNPFRFLLLKVCVL